MKLISSFIFSLTLLLLSKNTYAQDVTAWPCESCSSSQMESVAIQKGIGWRHVYSLQSGIIINFLVERLDTPQRPIVATAYDPDNWVIDQFAGIHQFYLDNGNKLDGRLSITLSDSALITKAPYARASQDDGFVDAYDIVESSSAKNRLSDAIASSPYAQFTGSMASFGRALRLAASPSSPDVPLTITVELKDSSTVIYKFNWDTKKWEYIEGSAKDSNNNSVPESKEDFVNGETGYAEFDFTNGDQDNYDDFLRRAIAYGITVIGGRGRVACVSVDNIIYCEVM